MGVRLRRDSVSRGHSTDMHWNSRGVSGSDVRRGQAASSVHHAGVAQFRNHSHPGARVARLDVPPAVRTGLRSQERAFLVLAIAAVVSLALKAVNVSVGAPQYMIDDFTLYEGGFLVWFGQAPPQHAFLEAWLC